ncbi:MAG TPA: SUMF1/EgtB/PvdO family nonheme iron enzyme [Thermotogota bacterium]|nr:SUMF1/EgtB/PvdO family nonheme iron enzyme [Thermotogota bacterium]
MMIADEKTAFYRIERREEPSFSKKEEEFIRLCLFSEILGKKTPFVGAQFSSLRESIKADWFIERLTEGLNPKQRDEILNAFRTRMETRERYLSETAEMIRVNAGSFQMGNTANDPEGSSNETPVHDVRLTYDFWIGKHPVTDYEFLCFLKSKNKTFPLRKGWFARLGTRPAVGEIGVNRKAAMEFCNWLSISAGLKEAYNRRGEFLSAAGSRTTDITQVEGYRLPTEAEWEYAARGGHRRNKDLPFSGHKDPRKVAWFNGNARGRPHEVGKKIPNALGIHDLCGNVCEWCQDGYYEYTDSPRENPLENGTSPLSVIRGGSWFFPEKYCRIAARFFATESWYNFVGFRLCRTITDSVGNRE